MTWLAQLFRPNVALPETVERVIDAWRALPDIDDGAPIAQTRFVIVDVETSGLNPRRDRLLSIGAVTVDHMRLAPRQAFNAVLRNRFPSTRENVLVHGLTPTRQAAGEAPERVLGEFLDFVGKAPCVAFHAGFDRVVLDRALRTQLGVRLSNPWLDLAQLAPGLFPQTRLIHGTLDDWLAHFRLRVHTRHDAVHDAHAAAELLLILLARAVAQSIETLGALRAFVHVRERFTTRRDIGGV